MSAEMKPIAPPVICADGVRLSVQASRSHYCTPRDDDGPYTEKEVGFIEDAKGNRVAPPESWREYGEGEFPSAVYGWVPVELIDDFIASHGGAAK